MAVAKTVKERLVAGMKRFKPIIDQQRARDVSEADTVTLVKDLLSEVFGYDKYLNLTSEHMIRGTFCDLAIKLDNKLALLVEVKSAGTKLDDRHVKQAIDYAANQGVEWVILTNASVWRFYQVIFAKPIDKRALADLDITQLDLRKECDVELANLLTKEGFSKGAHVELKDKQDATSRYVLSALILNNSSVLGAIRRELRRVVDVLVSEEEIRKVLGDAVIKRDAQEGPEAEAAAKRITRLENKAARAASKQRPASAPTESSSDNEPSDETLAAAGDEADGQPEAISAN